MSANLINFIFKKILSQKLCFIINILLIILITFVFIYADRFVRLVYLLQNFFLNKSKALHSDIIISEELMDNV